MQGKKLSWFRPFSYILIYAIVHRGGWKPSLREEKEKDGKILGFIASEAIRRGLTNGLFESHKRKKVAEEEEEVSQRIYSLCMLRISISLLLLFPEKGTKILLKKRSAPGEAKRKLKGGKNWTAICRFPFLVVAVYLLLDGN